jgi:hypothetical protein
MFSDHEQTNPVFSFNVSHETADGIPIFHMTPEPVVLRPPNPAYDGNNVFDAVDGACVELTEGDLLNRYRTALFILTQKDRPIPTQVPPHYPVSMFFLHE